MAFQVINLSSNIPFETVHLNSEEKYQLPLFRAWQKIVRSLQKFDDRKNLRWVTFTHTSEDEDGETNGAFMWFETPQKAASFIKAVIPLGSRYDFGTFQDWEGAFVDFYTQFTSTELATWKQPLAQPVYLARFNYVELGRTSEKVLEEYQKITGNFRNVNWVTIEVPAYLDEPAGFIVAGFHGGSDPYGSFWSQLFAFDRPTNFNVTGQNDKHMIEQLSAHV